jgi:hypothetical protein
MEKNGCDIRIKHPAIIQKTDTLVFAFFLAETCVIQLKPLAISSQAVTEFIKLIGILIWFLLLRRENRSILIFRAGVA